MLPATGHRATRGHRRNRTVPLQEQESESSESLVTQAQHGSHMAPHMYIAIYETTQRHVARIAYRHDLQTPAQDASVYY